MAGGSLHLARSLAIAESIKVNLRWERNGYLFSCTHTQRTHNYRSRIHNGPITDDRLTRRDKTNGIIHR